jgi:hypothetical protein
MNGEHELDQEGAQDAEELNAEDDSVNFILRFCYAIIFA